MTDQHQWPGEVSSSDGNTTIFAPVTVTIRKVFEGDFGTGWAFKEDTTPKGRYKGVIWNHRDVLDEGDSYSPYKGPTFGENQVVTVVLSVETGKTGKPWYMVRSIKPAEAVSELTEGTAAPAQAPRDLADPQRRSIEKQTVAKSLTDLLCAIVGQPDQLVFDNDEVAALKNLHAELLAELAPRTPAPEAAPEPAKDNDTP